jgi:ketosteroid isomerase-like protein
MSAAVNRLGVSFDGGKRRQPERAAPKYARIAANSQEARMNMAGNLRLGPIVIALCAVGFCPSQATAADDAAAVAATIKADVAQLIAGINARDVDKATAFDSPDVIFMECGSPPTVGVDADRSGFKEHFAQDPSWKVSLIDETVDLPRSEDLAIYRGVYNEDNRVAGALMTHKANFIAEFGRQNDGSWKMVWEIVSALEKSHPKK